MWEALCQNQPCRYRIPRADTPEGGTPGARWNYLLSVNLGSLIKTWWWNLAWTAPSEVIDPRPSEAYTLYGALNDVLVGTGVEFTGFSRTPKTGVRVLG